MSQWESGLNRLMDEFDFGSLFNPDIQNDFPPDLPISIAGRIIRQNARAEEVYHFLVDLKDHLVALVSENERMHRELRELPAPPNQKVVETATCNKCPVADWEFGRCNLESTGERIFVSCEYTPEECPLRKSDWLLKGKFST